MRAASPCIRRTSSRNVTVCVPPMSAGLLESPRATMAAWSMTAAAARATSAQLGPELPRPRSRCRRRTNVTHVRKTSLVFRMHVSPAPCHHLIKVVTEAVQGSSGWMRFASDSALYSRVLQYVAQHASPFTAIFPLPHSCRTPLRRRCWMCWTTRFAHLYNIHSCSRYSQIRSLCPHAPSSLHTFTAHLSPAHHVCTLPRPR